MSFFKKIGSGLKSATNEVGSGFKKAGKEVGSGFKTAGNEIGSGLHTATSEVGKGIASGAKVFGEGLKPLGSFLGNVGQSLLDILNPYNLLWYLLIFIGAYIIVSAIARRI